MTKKEYSSWLNTLCSSDDDDLREIGQQAKQAAWYLEAFIPCENHSTAAIKEALLATYGEDRDDDEIENSLKDGWITIHGKYIATWIDGLL